jgi:probable HAF family extracellular repeat protein
MSTELGARTHQGPPMGSIRSRTFIFVAAALLAGFAASSPARATVEYDFILIEAFNINYDLREVNLRDINESGFVSGTSTNNSTYAGFVWTEAAGKTIVPMTWPMGINNLNQIVSDGTIYDFDTGAVINVPPAGAWPVPRLQAINDNGVAVGFSECSCSNSGRTVQEALVWDAQNGSRTVPVSTAKELLRINNSNEAVGNIRGGSSGSEGFFYHVDTGTYVNMSDLLPPNGFVRGWSELMDINESSVACGRGWDGETVRGLTWSSDVGFTFLPPIAGGLIDYVYPRGINSSGTVVGFNNIASVTPRAFVWDTQNGMRNLNDLVTAPPNFILDWAVKINDAGWIVGIGHYGPNWGTSRGFVLRPIPDVATGVDLGAEPARPSVRLLANPVSERLDARFTLARDGAARVSVYDLAGRRLTTLRDGRIAAGEHSLSWTPPRSQASGVYVLRVESEQGAASSRFVLVR